MTTHRFRERDLVGTRELGLGVVGICLAAFALSACSSSSRAKVAASDAGNSSSPSKTDAKEEQKPDSQDAAAPQTCKQGSSASKDKGELCSCDNECRSGYCANGVCCTSSCTDKCKACNLPSSLGDCSLIPAGVPPADPSQCKASNPGSCGQDGTCDGNGGCQFYLAETVCSFGKCDGDGLSGLKTCDGKGNCSGDMSRPCAPYACNPNTNECNGTCSSNSQCAKDQSCVASSCGMKLNGYKCSGDGECVSGHCADGYCCNVACNSPCVSCALAGSYGRCRLVPAGQPDDHCQKQAQTTCGTTGLCDGAGSCTVWPADTTPCKSATCSGPTQLTSVAVCDGKGICKDPTLVDCSPYLCVSGQCNRGCKSDADCQPGHACIPGTGGKDGTCSGKKQLGQSCEKADECDSGQCVDKVCCDGKCEGACRSCALAGSPGRCTSLPAGARDARAVCADDGAASCGRNGLCDGAGSCQLYPAGTTKCGVSSCDSHNIFTDAPTCSATGQCQAPPSRGCDPFVCNGNVCLSSCSKDSDCVPPNTCKDGSCGKSLNGAECSSADRCKSGFCSQGVCCNAACTDACQACNLPSTPGVCAPVPDGSPDPQEKCKATESSSCGTTGTCKGGICANFDNKTPCKPASCANSSTLHPTSNCDGNGTCVSPADQTCGNFICKDNACLATCQGDVDCVPPNTCVNNSCGRKPLGAACTKADQCSSGFCTEGVCCDTACADGTSNSLCMSCKVTGKIGTCTAVPTGQVDPKQRCVASNPAAGNCSNDGTCNGKGGCRPWGTSVGCRLALCSGSSFSSTANCDGAGNCPSAPTSKCDPYKCGTGAYCLTTCKTSDDCVGGETCVQTTHQCGNKLPNGRPCAVPADCSSGFCSEGICCNEACGEGCKTCATGVCTDRLAGNPPRESSTCPAEPPCGNTGNCNGTGGCQKEPLGKVVGQATCAAPTSGLSVDGSEVSESVSVISAPTCNGEGGLAPQSSVSCHAYQCASGTCKTACSSTNADCNSLVPSASDPEGGNSCIMSGTSGTCQKLPNGSSCSTGAACQNGYCVNGTCCQAESCDDGLTCTLDTCATSNGSCSHTVDPNSQSCLIGGFCYASGSVNPANACEVCHPGTSTSSWSAISCSPSNACFTATCNPSTGCVQTAKPCTATDACFTAACNTSTGECVQTPKSCTPSNACFTATCDPITGCGETEKPCTATNACFTAACNTSTGECVQTAKTCTATNACFTATCNTSTGVCEQTEKPCTAKDACHTAACNPSTGECVQTPKACLPTNGCFTAECNTGTGECVQTPKACLPTNGCFTAECNTGTGECVQTPKACIPTNGCFTAECNTGTGECVQTPKACIPTNGCFTAECNTGSGECVQTPKACVPTNGCFTAECNTGSGECVQTPKACIPTNACFTAECNTGSGECVQTPKPCTATDACFTAECNTVTGECVQTPKTCPPGEKCDNGNCIPE